MVIQEEELTDYILIMGGQLKYAGTISEILELHL